MPIVWGQGYATEAANGVIGFARDVRKLEVVVAFALVSNEASIRGDEAPRLSS
jgi:RimJ/RimL family protein N-acetyltransferase